MHLMRQVDSFKNATATRVSHACNFNTLCNVANSKLWHTEVLNIKKQNCFISSIALGR